MTIDYRTHRSPSFGELFVSKAAQKLMREGDTAIKSLKGNYYREYAQEITGKPFMQELKALVEKRQNKNNFDIFVQTGDVEIISSASGAEAREIKKQLVISATDKNGNEIFRESVLKDASVQRRDIALKEEKNAKKCYGGSGDFRANWLHGSSYDKPRLVNGIDMNASMRIWLTGSQPAAKTEPLKQNSFEIVSPFYHIMHKAEELVNKLKEADVLGFEISKTQKKVKTPKVKQEGKVPRNKAKKEAKAAAKKAAAELAELTKSKETETVIIQVQKPASEPLKKRTLPRISRAAKKEANRKALLKKISKEINLGEEANNKNKKNTIKVGSNNMASKHYAENTALTSKEEYKLKKAEKIARKKAKEYAEFLADKGNTKRAD